MGWIMSQQVRRVRQLRAQLAHGEGGRLHLKGLSGQLALGSEVHSNQPLLPKAGQHRTSCLRHRQLALREATLKL